MGKREQSASARHFIFYVRGFIFLRKYQIYKLPLFLNPNKPSSPAFSLKRCTAKAPPEFSLARARRIGPSYLGRLNRHSLIRKSQIRRRRLLKTAMPKPYIEFKCTGFGAGVLPEETAMAALGSRIYLMGGYIWTAGDCEDSRYGMLLPTHVHMIDTASPGPPEIVKTWSELNSGKRSPVAWTVGGKIYVMPRTFVAGEPPGDFECLDPASGSWTLLPSPPFVNDVSKFTIPAKSYLKPDHPLLHIKNNTVLGSSRIVIVTHAGDIYSFDTAQPDKGWTSVTVLCANTTMCDSEKLNFLPFYGQTSVPVSDDLILSHWGVDSFPAPNFLCVTHFSLHNRMWTTEPYIGPGLAEKTFLKTRCGIIRDDTYACSVSLVESDSSTILSLRAKRVELPIRWEELVGEGPCSQWMDVTRIGDGLVLVAKGGGDEDCEPHCSFNVVRIEKKVGSGSDEDKQLVLTNLSSVLLTPFGVLPNHVCSFLMKDGTFTHGF